MHPVECRIKLDHYLKLWSTWYWVVPFDARLTSSLISALPKSQRLWEWNTEQLYTCSWLELVLELPAQESRLTWTYCFVIVLSDEVRRCLQQKSWSRLQMSQNCFRLDLRSYRSKTNTTSLDSRYTELHLATLDWGGNWLTNILTGSLHSACQKWSELARSSHICASDFSIRVS